MDVQPSGESDIVGWLRQNGAATFATLIQRVPALRSLSNSSLTILAPDDAAMGRLQAKISYPLLDVVEIPKILDVVRNHFSFRRLQDTPPKFQAVTGFNYGTSDEDIEKLQALRMVQIGRVRIAVISYVLIGDGELEEIVQVDSLLNYLEGLPYNVFLNIIDAGQLKGKDLVHLCSASNTMREKCERHLERFDNNGRLVEIIPQYVYSFLLAKEFGVHQLLPGKDAHQTYVWYSNGGHVCLRLFEKIKMWIEEEQDHNLKYPATIYDLLYRCDDENSIGTYMICIATAFYEMKDAERTYPSDEDFDKTEQLTRKYYKTDPTLLSQEYFFRDLFFRELPRLDSSHGILQNPPDHFEESTPGVRFTYDLMKNEYFEMEEDAEFRAAFELLSDGSPDILNQYPLLWSENLLTNPAVLDRDFIRERIQSGMEDLIMKVGGHMAQYDRSDRYQAARRHYGLTDEEIEFLVDLHFRVLDPADPLKITSLTNCDEIIP